jgi:L-2,4-diaminobutyric acid acetyltransferase
LAKIRKNFEFRIRNFEEKDVKEVYNLLLANRPYVGLNSRYTYFLLARDFSHTCIVAEEDGKIVAFSSGYVPPARPDTFFSWEIVVCNAYRGYGLQKRMILHQINLTNSKYFEGTVNPSNEVSKRNFVEMSNMLKTTCERELLFDLEDFENDGHEAEVLYRIGPISKIELKKALSLDSCPNSTS